MNQNNSARVNWGSEVLRVLGIIGKVLLRILSYLANIILTVLLIGLITGIIISTVFAIYINNYLDLEIDSTLIVTASQDSTTRIYYMDFETMEDRQNRNGTLVEIEDQRLYATENTIYVPYSEMPKNLINAFIAIEDQRFKEHNGVDWWTTAQAVVNFLLPTGKSAGGSTITQQLIKNVTGESDVTVQRKVEEIFRALNLEKVKSKEEILEAYLNIIYLGNNCNGVQAAANFYFGKDVSELTLVECASFAAIVKNPSQYEPLYHEDTRYVLREDGTEKKIIGNAERRWVVLQEMYNQGYITEEQCKAAQEETLNIVGYSNTEETKSDETRIFNWFTESLITRVRDDLMEEYGISKEVAMNMIYSGGLTIVTTMDPEVQEALETVYEDDESFPKPGNGGLLPQSAMVVCDPYTGDVLGVVGSRGEKTLNRGQNHATVSVRPPGSSIKPISVYAPALDAGIITYGSIIDDTPVYFNEKVLEEATEDTEAVIQYTPYPQNLPVIYRGLTTIHSGVTRSVNTIAMKVLQQYTVDKSFDFLKNELNINSLIEAKTNANGEIVTDRGLAALALGQLNYGLTVEEITAAYCIFPNDGIYHEPNLYLYVLDQDGNKILSSNDEANIVISSESASIMTTMLEEVMNWGTGMGCTLRHTVPVAGKTGTTSSDSDRYFVGYTPYYVGGVWTGYEYNQSLSAYGENPSLILWDKVMTILHQKYIDEANNGGEPIRDFEMSPGVITATYCRDSGKLCTEACALDPRGSRMETGYFTRETAPKEYCETHVIVQRDTSTELIACPNCNPRNLISVALIHVEDRSYPTQIYVEDAQYVYREMPDTIKPGGWWGDPFFVNMLGEDEYCGSTYVTTPYNAYCYKHCDYRPWGGNPPAEDSGYTPPEDDDNPSYTPPEDEDDIYEDEEETEDRYSGWEDWFNNH